MLPLDPTQPGFSWSNARACAERCSMAYHETESSLRNKDISGKIVWNSQTDTEALVINHGDCICVAFRGSSSLRNWLQDFKARCEHPRVPLIAYDGRAALIHQGFEEDVDSITVDLVAQVCDLCKDNTQTRRSVPLFITGHSKGAAEAILFALELDRQRFQIAGVYTFGQPRVGNRAFANLYNETLYEETFRVVNQNDIVPRVPTVLMGYKHCGQELFLPCGTDLRSVLNPSLLFKLFSDLIGLWAAWRHETDVLIADHLIAAYQSRIQIL
jgi:hypothetical protein